MTRAVPATTGSRSSTNLVAVLAWAALPVAGLLAAGTTAIALTGDEEPGDWGLAIGLLLLVGVGCLVAARRPRNPVGWLLALYGLGFELTVFGETLAAAVYLAGRDLPGAGIAAWAIAWIWAAGLCALGLAFLHFPDGRLPSARWRLVRWSLVAGAAVILAAGVTLWPQRGAGFLEMATGISGDVPWALDHIGLTLLGIGLPLSLLSLAVRYRGADPEQRLQLKWLVPSLTLMVVGVAIFTVAGRGPTVTGELTAIGELVSVLGLAGLVASMAVAIFKYRLYDIDRIISRTVAYLVVTALLGAVYGIGVVALRAVLAPVAGESDLAVAGSTLAVAALFRPVRRRVQAVVDHRFNRRRYDAGRAVASFSQRLRDEVDPHQVAAELRATAATTVEPVSISLWLPATGASP